MGKKFPRQGGIFVLLPIIVLGLVLGISLYLVSKKTNLLNFASNKSSTIVHGLANDLVSDLVLGQSDFYQSIPGRISPNKVAHPGGVHVDRSTKPNRIYIFDGANSRLLGYKSLGTCSTKPTIACTSDSDCSENNGGICQIAKIGLTGTKQPDIIIGQPRGDTSACNNDGTWHSYPDFPKPTASTLCSVPPDEPSAFEGGSWESPATDSEGNLYLADFYNNRVLKYNKPFETDTIADEVWGQPDFASSSCNSGGAISDHGFCFVNHAPTKPVTGSVDIDFSGNLWVVDGGNNRVLRFPKTGSTISKNADLVVGQSNFVDSYSGTELNKFNAPTAVRVDADNTVYVADAENGRVLYFENPTNGSMGKLLTDTARKAGSLALDPVIPSDPNSGGIWVGETDNHQIALWSKSGVIKKVLIKDTYRPNGNFEGHTNCRTQYEEDLCSLQSPRGAIGITRDGDLLAAGSYAESALYYKHPIPAPIPGKSYEAIARFFAPPFIPNFYDNRSIRSPRGIAITQTQIVVSDHARILFWSKFPLTQANINKPADGALMVNSFEEKTDPYFGRMYATNSNLWVLYQNSLLRFSLPLTHGATPSQKIELTNLKYINSNQLVGTETMASGIYVSPDDKEIWLSFPYQNRAARIITPTNLTGDFSIDVLIGGNQIPVNDHRWHEECVLNDPAPCAPGAITKDRKGNIVLSDYYIENEGTGTLYFFSSDKFPLNGQLKVLSVSDAFKKFDDLKGWLPAFGPKNEMVLGFAAFTGKQGTAEAYKDPTEGTTLEKIDVFPEHFAQVFSPIFDSQNNLWLTDMNRGRVLAYVDPFKSETVPNRDPVAKFDWTPKNDTSNWSPLAITFDASTSTDPDGDSLSYAWNFGDGGTSTDVKPVHTFTATTPDPGSSVKAFTVSLTVTDSQGANSTTTSPINIRPNKPPIVFFTVQVKNPTKAPRTVNVDVVDEKTKDPEGDPMTFRWNYGDNTPIERKRHSVHTYKKAGTYKITLTVTDKKGATTTAKKTITVKK